MLCGLEGGWCSGSRVESRGGGPVPGGRGLRARENGNFIPGCWCGTSVQQGPAVPPRRGQAPRPPGRLCAGRPPGRRAPRLPPPSGSRRSDRRQLFCFLKNNLWHCCDRRSYPGLARLPHSPPGQFHDAPPAPPPVRLPLPFPASAPSSLRG